jgi:hypothetical protein
MTLLQPGVDEDRHPKRRARPGSSRRHREITSSADCPSAMAAIATTATRPSGVWLPRQTRATGCPQAAYVYLLVHQSENRFKIGKSWLPRRRLTELPEVDAIDMARSLQVALPDRKRAGQVESLLHKALADFRLRRYDWGAVNDSDGQKQPADQQDGPENGQLDGHAQKWDGVTEWFSLPGLRHAIKLLRVLPGLSGRNDIGLQTLDGQPFKPDLDDQKALTPEDQRRRDLEEFNLSRIDQIDDVLMILSRSLEIRWEPACNPSQSAGILRIKNLKNTWQADLMKSRFEVVSSALWELKTAKGRQGQAVVALVRLIRYAEQATDDLELVFNALDNVKTVPGGAVIVRRWLGTSAGFAA